MVLGALLIVKEQYTNQLVSALHPGRTLHAGQRVAGAGDAVAPPVGCDAWLQGQLGELDRPLDHAQVTAPSMPQPAQHSTIEWCRAERHMVPHTMMDTRW